jgi:hypothetical protein
MKRPIFFLVLLLSFSPINKLFSQQIDAILYEDKSLTIKPKPLDKELYDKWFTDNSSRYGEDPNSGPGVPLKVTVLFDIDTLGNIFKPRVLRGIGFGFDEEAIRLVNENPNKWIPGYINNQPVFTLVCYQIDYTTNKNRIMTGIMPKKYKGKINSIK